MRKQHFVIKLENQELLQELCGENDCNIDKLEALFESKVISYGNEIIIETDNQQKQALFKILIDKIDNLLILGKHIDSDVIQEVFDLVIKSSDYQKTKIMNNFIDVGKYGKIFPKNLSQSEYIEAMNKFSLVFGIGPAGTGKTFLAVAHAISLIQQKRFKKLVITRPVVESGENLGFLPGDLNQKIDPYLRPVYDVLDLLLSKEEAAKFEERKVIEAAPLAYMRGRNLNDCYVILDEAQNVTKSQMKMFLTRLGENSMTVVTGDPSQIDLKKSSESGLVEVMRFLGDIDLISFHYFSESDVIRSKLVRQIVDAYERNAKII
ncbi:MAG: PhoH family protein [Spirochaetales bacterium]|nr:PhoH family protein [Spirochaetales bacterium]